MLLSDLGLFSTKSLVEANAEHPVEVRTQVCSYFYPHPPQYVSDKENILGFRVNHEK